MNDTEGLAEVLLLAMDGDFLPGAGMGVDNAGQDVALDKARPKEVAHWAADALAARVAAERAAAWDEGREAGMADEMYGSPTPNPYRTPPVGGTP